jgi:hypothetical protein
MQVRLLPPQLNQMEVIRLDEEPASKAGAGRCPVVGSSPAASAFMKHVRLAERQRRQPSKLDRRVRFPQRILEWVGSSAAERVSVKHQRVGSSPTRPSSVLRDSRCWQRCWALNPEALVRFQLPQLANFNLRCVSSNARTMRDRLMARCDALNVETLVRFQLPQLEYGSHPTGSKARRRPIGKMKARDAVVEHRLNTGGE